MVEGSRENPYASPEATPERPSGENASLPPSRPEPFAKFLVERFLLVWLTLLGTTAYCWTAWFPDAWDPFEGAKSCNKYVFSVTMLAIGSLLPRKEVRDVLRRWPVVLGGTTVQYLSMPTLSYVCGRLFGLDEVWMAGIIIVGCVPGAMASNVLTLVARGHVSYSVSLTTLATLVSPIVVPCALYVALKRWATIDPLSVSWELCWMVVGPVVAGHLLSRTFAFWQAAAQRFAAVVANLTILWIIAVVIGINRDKLQELTWQVFLALLTLNLLGYAAGWCGALVMRLSNPMRRALTIEIGMQNAGLGTILAMTLFPTMPLAAVPPAIYTFGCMFTGTVLAQAWALFGKGDIADIDAPGPG